MGGCLPSKLRVTLFYVGMPTVDSKRIFLNSVAHDRGFHGQNDLESWDQLTLEEVMHYKVNHVIVTVDVRKNTGVFKNQCHCYGFMRPAPHTFRLEQRIILRAKRDL